jgi:hypothetical protein
MQTITLVCGQCSAEFTKPLKEHTRRVKLGHSVFYCSRSCWGSVTVKSNFTPWKHSTENRNRLIEHNTRRSANKSPFSRFVRTARQRHSDVDITTDYLSSLWNIQDGQCVWSGIPLNLKTRGDINTQASLDRKDSSLGYVEGNVQFVSCALNYAKNNKSDNSVIALIDLIRAIGTNNANPGIS